MGSPCRNTGARPYSSNFQSCEMKPIKHQDDMPSGTRLPTFLIIGLLGVFGAGSAAIGYHMGQASMNPHLAAMQNQIESWKMIRRSDQALSEIKIAMRSNMSLEKFELEFGKVEPIAESDLPENITDKTHRYADAETKRVFYLKFGDEGLLGYKSGYSLNEAMDAVATN